MKVRVIAPVVTRSFADSTLPVYTAAARPDCEISVVCLDSGPASVESLFEDALAAPDVLRKTRQAQQEDIDAVVIDCMNDPGLEAAREAVSIPVVGVAQSAMLFAAMLAGRFSVISTDRRDVYVVERLVRQYDVVRRYASTRWVDIPVLALSNDRERMLEMLVAESLQAIQEDGAQAIVFGCTGMKGMARSLQERLAQQGWDVIVIDPSLAALKWAEMLVELGLAPSRRTYPLLECSAVAQETFDHSHASLVAWGELNTKPHLRVIVPVTRGDRADNWLLESLAAYRAGVRPDSKVSIAAIEEGPASILSPYYVVQASPAILSQVKQAQQEGADAAIIDCMYDPALEAAREITTIPVVGPCQTSMYLAASLSHRFSVLGTLVERQHDFENLATGYSLTDRLASVRAVGLSPRQVEQRPERLLQAAIREGAQAVLEDGAHLLIPGCTGMIAVAEALERGLLEKGLDVPVIDPLRAAAKFAEALVDLGLAQSKLTYPMPPVKWVAGYPRLAATP